MSPTEPDAPKPTYHDLHITTPDIPRTSIFNLPYGLEVTCSRTTGWHVMRNDGGYDRLLAGEYADPITEWLVLDVAGHVIVDSRGRPPLDPEDQRDMDESNAAARRRPAWQTGRFEDRSGRVGGDGPDLR